MDLHRTAEKPDWELVATSKRNAWQRLAARTNGWITPGNSTTVLGFGCIIIGAIAISRQNYYLGLVLVAIGRVADLLDGWLAAQTGTKSHLGAVLDSTSDKLATLLIFSSLMYASAFPTLLGLLLVSVQALIVVPIWLAHRQGVAIYPEWSGKMSMAATWLSFLAYLGRLQATGSVAISCQRIGLFSACIAIVLGSIALMTYSRQWQKSRSRIK